MAILTGCKTIPQLFAARVQCDADRTALWFKRDGKFVTLTWREVDQRVSCLAVMLSQFGVQLGDRVALLSENRLEWVLADLAIQSLGAISVPIHAPLTGEQISWQIVDSGAKVVLLSGPAQSAKLTALKQANKDLMFVEFDTDPSQPLPPGVFPSLLEGIQNFLSRLNALGNSLPAVADPGLDPSSVATILYTSGTTGEPKGVMLTQANLISNTVSTVEMFRADEEPPRTDYSDKVRLNFLPLSHIFARTCDLYIWLVEGSQLAIAESRETVIADAAAVKPMFMNGVPYFYDRVRRGLEEKGLLNSPGILRQLLGGRIEQCCSGGAALPEHLFDYYYSQGVPLLQGYGLSESSPVISISTQKTVRRGSAGKPIPGVEVKIAEDGEILTRGPHVMPGYYKNEKATAEIIKDGWLYTGDYGRIDDDGYLYITGRKKEIIVTSGGKNVAPVFLESLLTQDPLIVQALVIGDDRNYLTALLVPNLDALRTEVASHGIAVVQDESFHSHAQVLAFVQEHVNQRLSGVSSFEQVRKITLLPRGFTIEAGEMTAKLSLRRKVIEANFAVEIEMMYRK
ncbi:MAG: AMP-dependent synthetase/ligase [Pirellulaceae bacterium]